MICLNLNIPQVKKDYEELTKVFDSENIAYALLSKNNGYNLDYTPEGNESKLFQGLLSLRGIDGSRDLALKAKSVIYTKNFKEWSDTEPDIKNGMFVNSKGNVKPIQIPSNNLFSDTSVLAKFNVPSKPMTLPKSNLTGAALKFLNKSGEKNVVKILDESLATVNNPKFVKGMDRVVSMLENSNTFKDNGIFMHKGDKYIMHLNANLFEEIIDEQKLVNNMNSKMRYSLAGKGIVEHNVLSNKDSQTGKRYIVVTNDKYGEWTDLTRPTRKQDIFNSNLEGLERANKKFVDLTGKQGLDIEVYNPKNLNHSVGLVTVNEEALKEYNDIKYNQYLNSIKTYMALDTDVSEDLDMSTLQYRLNEERSQVTKEKSVLESTGGKQIDINRLENKLDDLKERIDKIVKDGELVDIYNEAEKNLIEVKDLLSSHKLTAAQFRFAETKLKMWISAGDFSQQPHMFLDEEMMQSKEIQQKFAELKMRAELMMPELMEKGQVILANAVNDEFGTKLTFDKIIELPHKIGAWFKNTLSINRVGQALAQYVSRVVNEANDEAHREVVTKSRDLAKLYKKVKDIGFDERLFYQMTDVKGKKVPTGRLVHKFSQKYFGENKINISFRKNNQLMIDPTKLSDPNYVQMLEDNLGKVGAKEYIDKAKNLYQNYLEVKEAHIAAEYGSEQLTNEQKADLEIWEKKNSPLERIKAIDSTKGGLVKDVTGKDSYLVVVPKRYGKNKQDLGYYDTNFNTIESNPIAYEFYRAAKDITNNAQTLYGYGDLKSTSLAFVKSGMMSKLSQVGVANFFTKELYDEMVQNLEGGSAIAEKIDPITKKPVKSIKLGTQTIDNLIKDTLHKKQTEKEIELGRTLTSDEIQTIYAESSEEVFSKMEFSANESSLFKSLNMLNLAALTFKHSTMIEDMVNISLTYLPQSTVNTGDSIIDSKGNTVGTEYIDNLKEMINYFLKEAYYKEPKGDTSRNLLNVKTLKDKAREKELQELLSKKDITPEQTEYVEKELSNLGGAVTVNSLFRNLISFMRLKGMGWNIPAGIANLAFGKITNLYKAAEGRLYNMKDWIQAEKSLMTQWGKFNKVTENYNIIGDILYQFEESNKFDDGGNWFFKTIKSLKPYAIQTATEKSNQGTVMIAMMMHQKVTNSKGENKSMWEAIDENGQLSDEWSIDSKSGDKAIKSMVSRIKSQIQEIHGDYSNPLLIKSTTAGQAVSMFRLWFFEAFHSRFGEEKPDYNRGITTKGRYRTWLELTKKYKLNPRALYRAYKNNELSEVDIANTKVNLTELGVAVLTMGLYALLKKGICGDDKSCKDANMAQLSILNMMQKINKDIQFYYNPKAWSDFIKNPTAMTGLLDDMWKLYSLSVIQFNPNSDEKEMIYQSGYHEGENRWNVFVKTQIPFVNSVERMKKFGDDLVQAK